MSIVKKKEVTELAPLIEEAYHGISDTLLKATTKFKEAPEEFVSGAYGVLFQAIICYSNLFKKIGCHSRESLEELWSSCYGTDHQLRDMVDDLLLLEEQWDRFLLEVDQFMASISSIAEEELIGLGRNATEYPLLLRNIQEDCHVTLPATIENKASLFILLRHFA